MPIRVTRVWLVESENVLHVVQAGGFTMGPFSSAEGASGEGVATGSFVGEFDTFADGGIDHGVIADDIAAADGVHPDFVRSAFSDDAESAVADIVVVLEFANFGEDFCEPFCGAGGGVFFEAVMHFDDFEVERGAEDFGGFAREPEEGVDSDAVVWREDDGDGGGSLFDGGDFFVGVSGCSDDEGAFVGGAGVEDGGDDGVV